MSFFDNIFGAGASQNLFGGMSDAVDAHSYSQAAMNTGQLGNPQAAMAAYSQAQQRRFVSHNWVFNGKPCSLHEFADAVWGEEEHPDKMLFILTHAGPKSVG